MTGINNAVIDETNVLQTSLKLAPRAAFGRFSRLPPITMTAMQTRQMTRPGRIPAANRPPIETPMSDP